MAPDRVQRADRLFHPVIVINKHASHLSDHARCHERDVAIHISIVGRDRMPRVENARNNDEEKDKRRDRDEEIAHAMILGRGKRSGSGFRRRSAA